MDRATIESLIHNPVIHEIVPELSSLIHKAKTGTACCGKNTVQKIPASSINRVKMALLGLPSDRKEKLKKILNADNITFNTINESGLSKVAF